MKKSFKTIFLSAFLSVLMLFCMIPQAAQADTSTVIPDDYLEVEDALRSATPTTIEINGSITLNNEVTVGANHTLSISSGSAIYLAGSCKLNIPTETDLTVNGGGKLVCHDTSSNTILVDGTLTLNDVDFEVYSQGTQVNSKLTATDCNIKIANSSGLGIISLGEMEITGGSLDVGNIGDYTTGVVSFSSNPISISDCEVELNSNGNNVTAIQGNMYIKNSEVYIKVDGNYGSQGISYSEKLIFDNSTVSVTNKFQSTGIHSYGGYGEASEFKIINGSRIQVKHQGSGTGIFISPAMSAPTSLIIDDSILELYPGGICALSLNNGAQIQGDNYGKIIFHEDSEIDGIPNKIKDRDVIVTTSNIITVGPSSAPAANNAISEGTYIWDGTFFSNTTVVPTDISFTAVQTGGASGTADSTGINITFSEDVTGLTEDKISITDGTGTVVKGTLSGSETDYTISLVSVTAEGTINLSIADFGSYRVTTPAQAVNVYKNTVVIPRDITFTATQIGGASGTADSTGINITFNEDITGFTEDKISITNGTGAAAKGTLNGSGSNYTISLTSVTAEGTVNLSITDFGSYRVTTSVQSVEVYKNTVSGNNPDSSGSSGSVSTKTDSNVVNGDTINATAKETDGILTSNVNTSNISDAIKKADESKDNPIINIVIDPKEDIDMIKVVILNDGWKQIAQKDNMSLQIKAGRIILTLDNAAISEIYKQAKKDIIIRFGIADKAKLTTAQQNSVGKNQAYDLSISSDNKVISEFNGKIAVKLPYALKSGENADSIIIFHVDEDGGLKVVKNVLYNATTKTVDFNTSHFSIYTIDNNHTAFSDITSEFWGKSVIDFSSARNLVSGVGNNRFEPNRAITRAEFTQMVYNVFELDAIDSAEFTDVKQDSWYYNAIMSCKKAGFFEELNLSDDEFMPNQIITREEMAVIVSNVAKYYKISTDSNAAADLTKFSDYDNINKDFVDNIIFAVNLGLLDKNGIGDGKFDPKGSTTRAQATQIQKNIIYILNITE